MVSLRVLVLAATLGGGGAAAAAAPARVPPYAVDHERVAVGEPLQLRLTRAVRPAQAALERLDLGALARDFEILERTQGRDSLQETLTLTLYPRRVGRFELAVPGWPGRAPRVTVGESSERVPRVQWKLSLEPPEPLLRQPTTFTLEACDDGSLLWQRPVLPAVEGLLLQALHETEIITTRDGQRCTAHRWHWALLPTASGMLTLPLPVVQAGKFGTRLRYAPPPLALPVQALPAWLPAEAAVGEPQFVAEPLPASAPLGQPLAWRLRVGGAYSPQALQALIGLQLRAADARLGLQDYVPQIERVAGATPADAPAQRVTLYLRPQARGTLALPALQLPWYDPDSGQLRQQALAAAPPLEVVDLQRQRWLAGAAVAAGLLLAAALGALAWHLLAWRWQRWRALRGLRRAPDLEALCAGLRAYGARRGEAPAPTLRLWQQRMAARWPHADLEPLLQELERARYGRGDAALATLTAQAVQLLRAARPGRRRRG